MKNLARRRRSRAGRDRAPSTTPRPSSSRRPGRRPHRRLRARLRALPGAHRQGPVPARDAPRRRCSRTSTRRRRRAERAAGRPRVLGEVVRRAMAKDPEERFPSAGDLGRAARTASGARRSRRRDERSPPDASPATGCRRPAPARARGRDRPRAVRRPRGAISSGSRRATPRPRRASASSSCSSGEPGIGKTRLATELGPRACTRGRDRALRPLGPRVARALPAVHRRAPALRRPPRDAVLPARARARAAPSSARFVPALRRHAPDQRADRATTPRRAATGCSRASRGCWRSPPASARWCCCSTTCTGRTRRRRCCSATCCRTPRPCGCSWSARARPRSSRTSC